MPLSRPVLVVQVGPVGLKPTSTGLRDRCIASSATTPIVSRRGGSRTLDLTLIRGLLSPLSYALGNRAGGTRTHTCRIKSPVCYRYTTTLCLVGRMRFNRVNTSSLPSVGSCQVVALRIELSATCSSDRFGQPALDYHDLSRDGRTRTCVLVLPGHAGRRYPTSRLSVRTAGFEPAISCTPSRRDTQASLRSDSSGSCGGRTRLCALKGRNPQSDRRTSHVRAQAVRSGPGGARTLVSWSSARRYTISATSPTKKPGVACDTGFSDNPS